MLGTPGRAKVWFTLLLIDYFLMQVFPKLVLGGIPAKTLISDRYIHDTIIDQAINFGYGPEETAALLRHPVARLFPRPTQTILIDLDTQVACSRQYDIEDAEYLRDRRHRYLALAERIGAEVIDGSGTIDEIHEAIWDALKRGPRGGLPQKDG